jgi:hypothetical protein
MRKTEEIPDPKAGEILRQMREDQDRRNISTSLS